MKILPSPELQPYIKYYIISENVEENQYKVLPGLGLVVGIQYCGALSKISHNQELKLASSGISGIFDTYSIFRSSSNTGTILIYFTEIGFAYFSACPVHELFNQSIALDTVFDKNKVCELEEKIALAIHHEQRISIVNQFFISQLRNIQQDKLIVEAVQRIYESKGSTPIKELQQQLLISPSPFEKRFRKLVGCSPKKFASLVRFYAVLGDLKNTKSLSEICYENKFFDQAHFIKNFKEYTGETPENFKQTL